MRVEDIVMTSLEGLPVSFEYLIIVMETIPMKEFMMNYVTTRLMHKMSKCKEKEPQGEATTMVLQQNKGGNAFPCQGTKSYIYCGKPSYIAYLATKQRTKSEIKQRNVIRNEIYSKHVQLDHELRSLQIHDFA